MPVSFCSAAPWTGREDPEDGAQARRFHHAAGAGAVALIGFACDAGVRRNKGRAGAAEAPAAIRAALANLPVPAARPALEDGPPAFGFSDLGDIAVLGDDLEAGQARLANQIARALDAHDRLIVLGGGHETAFASWSGLRQAAPAARIGIINIDAHLDLRLPGDAGPSSGTPFTQIRQAEPDRFDYLALGIAAEGNTQALFTRAADWGARIIPDHALLADPTAADDEIAALIARNDLVYLTIDLDALPHWQAPGVSAPAVRGLPLTAVEHLIAQVQRAGPKLRLADVVELCPPHDRDGMTAKTAAYLVRHLMLI